MSNASIFRSTIYLPSIMFCNYIFSPVHVIDWFHVIKSEFNSDNASQCQPTGMTSPGEGLSQGEEERPGRAERERAWSSWRTRGGGRPCCKTGGKHWTSGERWDRLINYIPFLHLSISITEIKGLCYSPINPKIPIRQWWDQWKTDLSLPQLQPSEGGKSPLKAATGNWGVIQTFKQIRRRTAQLSSPKPVWTSQTWLWKSPFEEHSILVRGWWPHHPTMRPTTTTPWSKRLSWSMLLFVEINRVKQNGLLCVFSASLSKMARFRGLNGRK